MADPKSLHAERDAKLIDRFGRVHRSMRLSVTDRCNIRCFYCMPNEAVVFRGREELLTFEEIVRVVRVAARHGVEKLRLTGGEPLVRQGVVELVGMLRAVEGIREIGLTTNGVLLADHASELRRAGLDRLNISLDTLHEERFEAITRRKGLDRVLAGIEAARQAGFERIRLNAVAVAGWIERDAKELVEYAHARDLEMRFIEYMPLDADRQWTDSQVLTGSLLRELLEKQIGPLAVKERVDPAQPSTDWISQTTGGIIGFIEPVSEPFCGACDRLRLTAEGRLRNCLFSTEEWDLRSSLRSGASDDVLSEQMRDCVWNKRTGHGIDSPDFERPQRAMYQIGG